MTILTTAPPPAVLQDEVERRHDLVADISALSTRHWLDASALQSRPAILRRLASLLAHVLPSGIDRLVARASTDAPLATAVALHSGISFALLDNDGHVVLGDLYPSEKVVLVETLAATVQGFDQYRLGATGAILIGVGTAVTADVGRWDPDSFALAVFRPTPVEQAARE